MKISVNVVKEVDDEIIINCKKIDENIIKIQNMINNLYDNNYTISFYKDNIEYFLSLDKILFFETEGNNIYAHTIDELFAIKYKLYELEKLLPYNFVRISKSTIVNINHIYSVDKNITSSSTIHFYKSHKQVFASRMYYKILKEKLEERRKLWN